MRLRVSVVLRHLSFVFVTSFLSVVSAHADYLLAPGDRVSLEVIGVPDLTATALVDTEGRLNLPIVGWVPAAGRSPDELQADVARMLSLKPIQMPGAGEEVWIQLDASRVYVSVAEYRPVYVTGAVRVGGGVAFRPGMTVRQVLVSAGGIGPSDEEVSLAEVAQTRADRKWVADRLLLAHAELRRLEMALADLQMDRPGEGTAVQAWDQTADELRRLETALAALQTEQEREDRALQIGDGTTEEVWRAARSNLRHLRARTADLSLQRMKERLAVLEKLAEVDAAALQSYEAEFTRVTGLSERGIATANALAEAERGVLAISSRALETSAETHSLRVDISQAAERTELEQTSEEIELLTAMLSANALLLEHQAQLDALDLQLEMLGAASPSGDIRVVIYRGVGAEARQLQLPMDAMIEPGDVVVFDQRPDETQ